MQVEVEEEGSEDEIDILGAIATPSARALAAAHAASAEDHTQVFPAASGAAAASMLPEVVYYDEN
eukprot:4900939-Lingulodinium_polyedra.AAC.1